MWKEISLTAQQVDFARKILMSTQSIKIGFQNQDMKSFNLNLTISTT
jgi:hypothetical protein